MIFFISIFQKDLSDLQYRIVRKYFPLVLSLAVIFLSISFLLRHVYPRTKHKHFKSFLLAFYAIFSLVFLWFAHQLRSVQVISVVLVNFSIAKIFGSSKWSPFLTCMVNYFLYSHNPVIHFINDFIPLGFWNLSILFTCDKFAGYPPSLILGSSFSHLV